MYETVAKIKLVIFDVAGTIIEDHGEVVDAFDVALEKNGMTVSPAEVIELKGASKLEVISRFVERKCVNRLRWLGTVSAIQLAFECPVL